MSSECGGELFSSRSKTTIQQPTGNYEDCFDSINSYDMQYPSVFPSSSETTIPHTTVKHEDSLDRVGFNPIPNYPILPVYREPTSIVLRQGEARSVFVVVGILNHPNCSGALFEVQLKQGGDNMVGGGGATLEPALLKPVANFYDGFFIHCARIFSRSKLYVLLEEDGQYWVPASIPPFPGVTFDTKTRSIGSFTAPKYSKRYGTVVSAYGKLYYFATPACFPHIPDPSFERYDPVEDIWEELPSFPFYCVDLSRMSVVGYAVCYCCILFSMTDFEIFKVFAFHVTTSKWHLVEAYSPFLGRAVVVDETIYAISLDENQVIAFSFRMDEGAYSLSTPLALHGLKIVSPPFLFSGLMTTYLVHLGNRDFCHVQTDKTYQSADLQHLRITTFQIVVGEGGSCLINTLHSTVCALNVRCSGTLFVNFSFTSDCQDFEPVEGERVTSMKQPKQEESKLKEKVKDRPKPCYQTNWGHDGCLADPFSISRLPKERVHEREHKSRKARSVFVVVGCCERSFSGALFEVKLKREDMGRRLPLKPVTELSGSYFFQSARIFSRSKLYLLRVKAQEDGVTLTSNPFEGYTFDMKTRSLDTFIAPKASKSFGTIVSAYEKLYHFASPTCFPLIPKPSFECYDPDDDTWEELPPFPFYSEDLSSFDVVGYAVCFGCILFSMTHSGKFRVFAFRVSTSEWYLVESHAFFLGRAVVVGGTIYAVSQGDFRHNQIIALSFRMDEGDDGRIAYSLSRPIPLEGLKTESPLSNSTQSSIGYLVHLGNQDFCHVQSCYTYECDLRQDVLCITTFEIVMGEGGRPMINTLCSTDYVLDLKVIRYLFVNFCFSPDLEDFEPEEGESVSSMKQLKQWSS